MPFDVNLYTVPSDADPDDVRLGDQSGLPPVVGAGTATDAPDIGAGAGNVVVGGTGTALDVADTGTGAGAPVIQGAGTATDVADTGSGASSVVVQGSATAADVADNGAGVSSTVIQGAGTAVDVGDAGVGASNVVDGGTATATDAGDAGSAASSVVVQGAATAADGADVGAGVGGLVETAFTASIVSRVMLTRWRGETDAVMASARPVRAGVVLVAGANTLDVPSTARAVMIRVVSGSAHVVLKGSAGDTGIDLGTLTISSPAIVLPLSSASVVLEADAAIRLAVFLV